jgi:hypothetical protein
VRAYCKENLTGYKQPKVVEFRAELPKTPVGKILRRELRDKFLPADAEFVRVHWPRPVAPASAPLSGRATRLHRGLIAQW